MFIIVRDSKGHGIPEVGVRLIAVGLLNPDGSNQSEYRHTDEAGNCAWTWYPHDAPGGYTIEVNTPVQNYKPQYSTETLHVTQEQLEGQQTIFNLTDTGSGGGTVTCPVNHDKTQFTNWFNKVKVGNTVNPQNMAAMKPALVACGMEWQNMIRSPNNPSDWRPRIHQPPFLNGPGSGSTHDVDCGDLPGDGNPPAPPEGGPWKLTFRY